MAVVGSPNWKPDVQPAQPAPAPKTGLLAKIKNYLTNPQTYKAVGYGATQAAAEGSDYIKSGLLSLAKKTPYYKQQSQVPGTMEYKIEHGADTTNQQTIQELQSKISQMPKAQQTTAGLARMGVGVPQGMSQLASKGLNAATLFPEAAYRSVKGQVAGTEALLKGQGPQAAQAAGAQAFAQGPWYFEKKLKVGAGAPGASSTQTLTPKEIREVATSAATLPALAVGAGETAVAGEAPNLLAKLLSVGSTSLKVGGIFGTLQTIEQHGAGDVVKEPKQVLVDWLKNVGTNSAFVGVLGLLGLGTSETSDLIGRLLDGKKLTASQSDMAVTAVQKLVDTTTKPDTPPPAAGAVKIPEIQASESLPKSEVTDQAYKDTVANGGVTIDLGGNKPTEGYAYSPFKDTETIVPKAEFQPNHIDNFVDLNYNKLKESGNHLGIWEEDGKIYMDVSQVGPANDATITKAESQGQLAVFDLKSFETKYTKLGKAQNEKANLANLNSGEIQGASSPGNQGSLPEIPGSVPKESTPTSDTTPTIPSGTTTETVKPKPNVESTILRSGLDPGIDKLIEQDIKPSIEASKGIGGAIKKVFDTVKTLFGASATVGRKLGMEEVAAYNKAIFMPEKAATQFDAVFSKAEDYFNKFTKEDVKNFNLTRGEASSDAAKRLQIEAMEKVDTRLTDPKFLADIKAASDWVYKYAKDNGIDMSYMEDYFYGSYKNKDAVTNFLNTWKTTERYTKEKVLPTPADAAAAGLELRNPNPITNIKEELVAVARRVGMKELRSHIESQESGSFATTTDKATALQNKEWKPINDPVFGANKETGAKGMLFERDYANAVNNLISTNKLSQPGFKTLREIGFINQQVKFFGSIFHLKNMVKASIADEYGGILNPKGYYNVIKSAFTKVKEADPQYQEYVGLGGGHKFSLESGAQDQMTKSFERLKSGNVVGGTLRLPAGIAELPVKVNQWMFDEFIPNLKFNKYQEQVSSMSKKLGRDLTDAEKTRIIMDGQNFYGEMNERMFGRSGTATSALRIIFQAPGYGEGNLRTIVNAATGNKRSINFVVNSLITTVATATAGTAILTGKWPKPPKRIEDLRDLFKIDTGKKDKSGNPVMLDLMTYDKDYWMFLGNGTNAVAHLLKGDYQGALDSAKKVIPDFEARISSATSTNLKIMADLATVFSGGQLYDYKGDPEWNPSDTTSEKFSKFLSREWQQAGPISLSVLQQSLTAGYKPGAAGILAYLGEHPTSTQQVVESKASYKKLQDLLSVREKKQTELDKLFTTNPQKAQSEMEKFNASQKSKLRSILPNSTDPREQSRIKDVEDELTMKTVHAPQTSQQTKDIKSLLNLQ
jgi:hypothetical protein